MHKFVKILLFIIGGIISLAIVGVVILFFVLSNAFSGGKAPTHLDDERLQTLQNDPMYSLRYPNMIELSRVERGSRGFSTMGTEDPPVVMYYAGTDDSDDAILRFFIEQATSNGWYIFRELVDMNNVDRVSVILHKDDVGSLFVRTYDPEHLNSFLGNKLPTAHSTIFQITLQAKLLER